jgi:large subunit ribosomal protein L23
MELTLFDIIQSQVASLKAFKLNQTLNKFVIVVHMDSTKKTVKDAVERLFGVKVKKVNILIRPAKARKIGRRMVLRSEKKRAIVTLQQGYTLNMFNQAGAPSEVVVQAQQQAAG